MARGKGPVRVRIDRVTDVVRIDEIAGIELDVEPALAHHVTNIESGVLDDRILLAAGSA